MVLISGLLLGSHLSKASHHHQFPDMKVSAYAYNMEQKFLYDTYEMYTFIYIFYNILILATGLHILGHKWAESNFHVGK